MPNYNFAIDTSARYERDTGLCFAGRLRGKRLGVGGVWEGGASPQVERNRACLRWQVTKVLYPDTDDKTYASAVSLHFLWLTIRENSTDITVTFHLPPEDRTEEPRWHAAPSELPSEPQTGIDGEGRIFYMWNSPNANMHSKYQIRHVLPNSYVPDTAIVTAPPAPSFFDKDSVFHEFTHPQLRDDPVFCFLGFMFFGMPIMSAINANRRKLKYLPPKISIEGHGTERTDGCGGRHPNGTAPTTK